MRSLLILTCLVLTACSSVPPQSDDQASSSPRSMAPYDAQTFVKPSDDELQKFLTPTQYQVTQKEATETPYQNEYWDHHEAGLYVDIVSGEPLFSSLDKYDSGTGWPSFKKPLTPEAVTEHTDTLLGYTRTEVRSTNADSHLGHVFTDGPQPLGLRYCMNSASLLFVPFADLEKQGYGQYKGLFSE